MLKKCLVGLVWAFASMCALAAVDVNQATEVELDGIKGIGPAMSKKILDARKAGNFKDWSDLMARVKGIKDKKATKLSGAGLTVNGQAFGNASVDAHKAPEGKGTKKAQASKLEEGATTAVPVNPGVDGKSTGK
jgi:competence protein ComEA